MARLLNDFMIQKALEYEASGYPMTPSGVSPDAYRLAIIAGREYQIKDTDANEVKKYIYTASIEELEHDSRSLETSLHAAQDPNISISSANPNQYVHSPIGNALERRHLRENAVLAQKRLSSRRSFIYSYALQKHHELKFSGIADDIFSRIRDRVDSGIGSHVPTAAQKLAAVYENLQSDNPEDWSNAVHSCRRILQDLADVLYPPRADTVKDLEGKRQPIKLGADNYVNRLTAFLEERSSSERFTQIVGSHLSFIGERLDSVFRAAQKGSHATILGKEEADRYVVYTYLIVGDILSLQDHGGHPLASPDIPNSNS